MEEPLEQAVKSKSKAKWISQYRRLAASRGGRVSDSVCCDLAQNPEHRIVASPYLPSTQTSAELCIFGGAGQDRVGYIPTPLDLSYARGWPVVENEFTQKWKPDLGIDCFPADPSLCSIHSLRNLHGNAIHLPTWAAWHTFISCFIVKRDFIYEYQPDNCGIWCRLMERALKALEREDYQRRQEIGTTQRAPLPLRVAGCRLQMSSSLCSHHPPSIECVQWGGRSRRGSRCRKPGLAICSLAICSLQLCWCTCALS